MKELSHLEVLSLNETNINNESLKYLPQSLIILDISWCNHLTNLNNLPSNLEFLNASGYNYLKDDGIKYLPQTLKILNLSFTNISEESIKYLPKNIKCFNLKHTSLINQDFTIDNDNILKYLPPLLEHISVDDTIIEEIKRIIPNIEFNYKCSIYDYLRI